jgi:serine/threonine protein kinase
MFVIQNKPPSGLTDADRWSPEFNDFIKRCLTLDPNDRPTATELLSHIFIS